MEFLGKNTKQTPVEREEEIISFISEIFSNAMNNPITGCNVDHIAANLHFFFITDFFHL